MLFIKNRLYSLRFKEPLKPLKFEKSWIKNKNLLVYTFYLNCEFTSVTLYNIYTTITNDPDFNLVEKPTSVLISIQTTDDEILLHHHMNVTNKTTAKEFVKHFLPIYNTDYVEGLPIFASVKVF
jgi:hypothetical protein